MKKIIVLSAIALVVSLSACTKKEAAEAPAATEAPAAAAPAATEAPAAAPADAAATPPAEQETKKEEAGAAH